MFSMCFLLESFLLTRIQQTGIVITPTCPGSKMRCGKVKYITRLISGARIWSQAVCHLLLMNPRLCHLLQYYLCIKDNFWWGHDIWNSSRTQDGEGHYNKETKLRAHCRSPAERHSTRELTAQNFDLEEVRGLVNVTGSAVIRLCAPRHAKASCLLLKVLRDNTCFHLVLYF